MVAHTQCWTIDVQTLLNAVYTNLFVFLLWFYNLGLEYFREKLTAQQNASMKKQEQIAAQQQQQIKMQAEALEHAREQQKLTMRQVSEYNNSYNGASFREYTHHILLHFPLVPN